MIWVDAQLSPALAGWLSGELHYPAQAVRDLGLHLVSDEEIFRAARQANAVVLTKDVDFVELLTRLGPPPQVVWLTCGNTSTAALRVILQQHLPQALALLQQGEALVEIS
jgi:predicted nuclease of predicted toxin-antitoxin system